MRLLLYHILMTKVDVYNTEYTKLNHAYIEIFDFYSKMIECKDADEDVLVVLENILRVFNPTLDKIKSEMTVKTRYKDDAPAKKSDGNPSAKNQSAKPESGEDGGNPYILTGNFTGE